MKEGTSRLGRTFGVLALLMLPGCTLDGGQDPGVSVSDSAGVSIVINTAPRWATTAPWRVSESPLLEIGMVDGAPEYLFDRIVGAITLSDGRIAVADMGSAEVRVFDAAGRHLTSFGSEGDGPGEFRQVIGLFRLPGDAMAVIDRLNHMHVFDSSGAYRETLRIGTLPMALDPLAYHEDPPRGIRIVGWLQDGTFLAYESSQIVSNEQLQFVQAQTLELEYSRYSMDPSPLNTIVRIAGPTFEPHPMNLVLRSVFTADVLSSTDREHLVLGLSGSGEVRWYDDDGQLIRIGRRAWPVRPVTEETIDEFVGGSSPRISEELLRGRTFAAELPTFSGLLCDGPGNVWLRRYEPDHATMTLEYVRTFETPSSWSVLDSTGRWLGDLTTPARFSPLEIGGDYVLGLYRDEFEVEYIRAYALTKPDQKP